MIEYILQERNELLSDYYWFDIYKTDNLDLICKIRNACIKKYSFKKYRIVSVII